MGRRSGGSADEAGGTAPTGAVPTDTLATDSLATDTVATDTSPTDTAPTDTVVQLDVAAAGAERAAVGLWDLGATAVGESTLDGATVRLVASFPTAAAAQQVAAELGASAVEVDGSWRDAWRAFAQAVEVPGGLVVAPAWRSVAVADDRLVIEIDPGQCFGSGTHPSTRLILGLLATHPPVGLDVVDVGTGSGVLAVAAAALGGRSVLGVDLDPASPAVTSANAARNGVADRVTASTTPVDGLAPGGFDLALVNVTAAVHAELGAATTATVRGGGRLYLAGLLPGQWRHVADAYPGCEVIDLPELDGWVGAVLRRR